MNDDEEFERDGVRWTSKQQRYGFVVFAYTAILLVAALFVAGIVKACGGDP